MLLEKDAHLQVEELGSQPVELLDYGDASPPAAEGLGDLQADQPSPHDGRLFDVPPVEGGVDGDRVFHRAQRIDTVQVDPVNRRDERACSGGDDQVVVGIIAALAGQNIDGVDDLLVPVDRFSPGMGHHVDIF